jgi:hypothetical protein
MKWNAIRIAAMLAIIWAFPTVASAQTDQTTTTYEDDGPVHRNFGVGFHSVDAPLGFRWWFGGQKVGLDVGLGFRSEPAPSYDEDLTGWALELGVPIVLKSWERVHVLFRPGFFYDSQEVEMSDPPDPFATDDRTEMRLTAELEAEVFIVDNFSVSASHGIGFFTVDPAGGGDSNSSINTLGNNFSHIGFHIYFLGGGS